MAEQTVEKEVCLTFSDEDFERRYSPEEAGSAASSSGPPSSPASQHGQPPTSHIGRSRNRFMRTLLRRRLLSSGSN
jgi:hypothetical protein